MVELEQLQMTVGNAHELRDCAKLWRVQKVLSQISSVVATLSQIIEEVHQQCDRTAL